MIKFTENQEKTIASGITLLSLAVVIAFAAAAVWFAAKAVSFLSPALLPVVMGILLAMFFKPYYRLWLGWVKNPALAASLMSLSVLVPLGVLLYYFGSFAASQIGDLVYQAPERAKQFSAWFNESFPRARQIADGMGLEYQTWTEGLKNFLMHSAIGIVGYMSSFLNLIVSLVFFVYFLTRPDIDGRTCVKEMPFLKNSTRDFVAEQIDAFLNIVVGFFQRQTLICLAEGVYYGAAFALCRVPYGFFIGFALGVLNLVPFLGTITCLPVALPLAYWGAGGSAGKVIAVALAWFAGQILDGYLITPKIQGGKTGLGYAGVIFSFFFWGIVFNSLLGLLLAIPLSAFWVVLWRAIKSRYIKPVL